VKKIVTEKHIAHAGLLGYGFERGMRMDQAIVTRKPG